jgi:hypothetical protein
MRCVLILPLIILPLIHCHPRSAHEQLFLELLGAGGWIVRGEPQRCASVGHLYHLAYKLTNYGAYLTLLCHPWRTGFDENAWRAKANAPPWGGR